MSTAEASSGATTTGSKRFNLAPVQKFGRSLMLPIAALPVAALLARFGAPDILGADGLGWDRVAAVVGAAGGTLFVNLGFLFAVGVAIGMAKKADGSTALAAVVGYLVFKAVTDAMSPYVVDGATVEQAKLGTGGVQYGVLGGIVIGLIDGVPLAALPPDQAAAVPRVLRRPPVRPDHHVVRRDRRGGPDEPGLPGVQLGPDQRR